MEGAPWKCSRCGLHYEERREAERCERYHRHMKVYGPSRVLARPLPQWMVDRVDTYTVLCGRCRRWYVPTSRADERSREYEQACPDCSGLASGEVGVNEGE